MEILKKLILALLGLGIAIALAACDDQTSPKNETAEKNLKERHHRKW